VEIAGARSWVVVPMLKEAELIGAIMIYRQEIRPFTDKQSAVEVKHSIARLNDLPAGGGTAALLNAWRLGDLDGKPEGLAFTRQGRAIVGLDTRKARRNLVLLEPAVVQLRARPKGAATK
jgi:hypothetical protein